MARSDRHHSTFKHQNIRTRHVELIDKAVERPRETAAVDAQMTPS
jgi:hypothetical protein